MNYVTPFKRVNIILAGFKSMFIVDEYTQFTRIKVVEGPGYDLVVVGDYQEGN